MLCGRITEMPWTARCFPAMKAQGGLGRCAEPLRRARRLILPPFQGLALRPLYPLLPGIGAYQIHSFPPFRRHGLPPPPPPPPLPFPSHLPLPRPTHPPPP